MDASDSFRERALRWLPGGSNGEYGIPEGDAPVIDRGAGCRVWDTAGREYLDMTMAWGAALVGHAHPKVLEAANAAAARGANFAAVTRPMVKHVGGTDYFVNEYREQIEQGVLSAV